MFLASFFFVNVLAEVAGGEFGFWKFQLYPRIIVGTIVTYLWFYKAKNIYKVFPFIFTAIGILGMITGARSSGLIPFITGILQIIIQNRHKINLKAIKRYIILTAIILYIFYSTIYVPNVLNGTITGGNSQQLQKIENPYNPLNLIMLGRSTSIIPFIAFMDNPITGWGYSSKDPDYKYHKMTGLLISNNSNENNTSDITNPKIPGHSVLGYYACSYGVIVFLALLYIVYSSLKYLYHSIPYKSHYLPYCIYLSLTTSWDLLFSPISHFKWLPISLAIIITFSKAGIKNSFIDRKNNIYSIKNEKGNNYHSNKPTR